MDFLFVEHFSIKSEIDRVVGKMEFYLGQDRKEGKSFGSGKFFWKDLYADWLGGCDGN
jgi:hypothetical protein